MSFYDGGMLKRTLAACLLLCATAIALAGDWTYTVKNDEFDKSTTFSAAVTGDRSGWLSVEEKPGAFSLVTFSGQRFECFPGCEVLLKFDDDLPMRFSAFGARIISSSIAIKDVDRFVQRVKTAKTLVLRAPQFNGAGDLAFTIGSAYDPAKFQNAERIGRLRKQCSDNAVNENYSACMDRLSR